MKYFEMIMQRFNNTSKKDKIIIVVILLVFIIILGNVFSKSKVDEQKKLEMTVDNYIKRLENTDYSYYMNLPPQKVNEELFNKEVGILEYLTIMIKYTKDTISQYNSQILYCEREQQTYNGNTYKELKDEIEFYQVSIKYFKQLIDYQEHYRDKVILFYKKKISKKKVMKYKDEFVKEVEENSSMLKLELKAKGLEYIENKLSGNNKSNTIIDIQENLNIKSTEKEIGNDNSTFYSQPNTNIQKEQEQIPNEEIEEEPITITGIEQAINDGMLNNYIAVGVTEKELRSAYYDGNLQFYYDSWEECLKDAKKLKILRTNEEI